MSADVLLALGCNLAGPAGGRIEQLSAAVAALAKLENFELLDVSALYETPPWPADQIGVVPAYYNAVLSARTATEPSVLLAAMLEIETKLGRERSTPFQARCIDIDLIAAGPAILPSQAEWEVATAQMAFPEGADIVLPHPRTHARAFVLKPLLDIAPDYLHPVYKTTMHALYISLPEGERLAVKEIAPKGWHL